MQLSSVCDLLDAETRRSELKNPLRFRETAARAGNSQDFHGLYRSVFRAMMVTVGRSSGIVWFGYRESFAAPDAMYNSFFGFRENPFNLSPDPEFLYRSPQHEEALANLIYGVRSRKGFIALTGEVGTGKTTMLECLRDYLDAQRMEFAFIFNSRLTPEQFFEMIAYDFDLQCDRKSKTDVLFALNALLIEQTDRGRTAVLIVDEAHNLEWDVLEEIRLLGNLENRQGKLLQIILSGQPELDRKLDAPNLRQLKQRIVLRCSLNPLTQEETHEYIDARLSRAGMDNQTLFSPAMMDGIHTRALGIPRLINAICDNLLVTAFAMERRTTTPGMLDEVCRDMRLEWPGNNRERRGRSRYGTGYPEEHLGEPPLPATGD